MPVLIVDHKLGALNEALTIRADERDSNNGNASRVYNISYVRTQSGDADDSIAPGTEVMQRIVFQNGPLKEAGINGISDEALLVIVLDRLRCFQQSKFICRENSCAIMRLEEALHWLQHRTRSRMLRGVEGTHNP